MNLQEIKYDAFISYRHCELDQFVAVNLHKQLEAFRLPKTIEKQLRNKGKEKKKIERVFRDRDELPITNNLADPITNALQNSEFLLVICSPRLRESLWCRKEIETFIKMHGREKVFAVLIEGEPADSFPEELLYEEKIVVDADGREQIVKVPIEPLAADVRGKNKKEIRKRIKEEVLRLAAPMFDCSYDDLKQRHRERMIRRIVATAGSISAVFAAFGIVSSVMAYQINQQSIQIKEQSAQIREQADQINEQYQEALRTNAKQMAEDAFDLMERGDVEAAQETAYQAISGEMPYTSEAEYALTSSMQLYRTGYQIAPKRLLKQDSQISFCMTSPDMTKLMVVDVFGNMTIYNPLTGEELYHTFIDSTYMSEEEICFINNDEIAYPIENGFAVYNMESKEERHVENESIALLRTDVNGKYLLTMRYDHVNIYDTSSLMPVYSLERGADVSFSYAAMFSRGGRELAVAEYSEDSRSGVYIIDFQTQAVNNFLSDSESITSMWVEDEYIYLSAYSQEDETVGVIYCITAEGDIVWEYETIGFPDDLLAFGAESDDKLAFTVYSKIIVIDKESGNFICQTDCGRDIVNFATYTDSDALSYMTRGGEFHYYMIDTNNDMVMEDKFISNSDNLMEFVYGKGFYASATYDDSAVAVYETVAGPDVVELINVIESPLEIKLSYDEKYLVSYVMDKDFQLLVVVDLEKKKLLHEIHTGSHVNDFAISDENELVVLHRDFVEGYDLLSGKQTFRRETETSNEFFLKNGEIYIADNYQETILYDTQTGDVLITIEGNQLLQDGMLVSDIAENGDWYAYSSEEEKKLVIGSFDKGDMRFLDVNINAIESITLATMEQVVYLSYLDDSVEVYNINTGEFVRRYDKLAGTIIDVIELPEIDKTILSLAGGAYLLNGDKEIVSFMEGFECYKGSTDSFILSKFSTLYEVPRYDLDELHGMMQ